MIKMMKPLAMLTTRVTKVPAVAKLLTKASRNKPEIIAIVGGVCIVTGFIKGIIGGTKIQAVMTETANTVEALEEAQKARREAYTKEDGTLTVPGGEAELIKMEQRELKKARSEGTWKIAKLFVLPSGLVVVGLVLVGGGLRILRKRNIVLAGAASGWEKLYKNLSKNIEEAEGKEALAKYERGIIGDQEVETVVVDENGKEKTVKKHLPVVKEQKGNPWRFEFSDNYFDSYESDTERNLFFLKCEEDWWNHELERHGEVSMFEVLKHLGYKFDVMKSGCADMQEYRDRMTFLRNYGWRKGCGDGFIDFGLYRAINEAAVSRKSDIIFVEFNCAGNLQNLSVKDYTK